MISIALKFNRILRLVGHGNEKKDRCVGSLMEARNSNKFVSISCLSNYRNEMIIGQLMTAIALKSFVCSLIESLLIISVNELQFERIFHLSTTLNYHHCCHHNQPFLHNDHELLKKDKLRVLSTNGQLITKLRHDIAK